MTYASSTNVSEDRSRSEIEKVLQRYGASRFGCMTDFEQRKAMVCFVYRGIPIQLTIPLPDRNSKAFTLTNSGKWKRSEVEAAKLYEQEIRRKWRCLSLAIKAKLVACEDGITTFEREFMPYMVTADGQTIADKLLPVVEAAKLGGILPATLSLPAPKAEGGAE